MRVGYARSDVRNVSTEDASASSLHDIYSAIWLIIQGAETDGADCGVSVITLMAFETCSRPLGVFIS